MSTLLETLNSKQAEAVQLPAEHALILAGAGSGKTRVLTTRIAWLIEQGYANPWQILAVTFTNKAAKEMSARLETMLKVDVSSMWVGTFHGISHRFLRLHAQEAGLPKNFQIIDQSDQLSLIKRLMKEASLDTEIYEPKKFQVAINRFKEAGLRSRDIGARDAVLHADTVYASYEARCEKEGLVDFAELLLRSVELLERNEPLRKHYASRLKFLLIDEFQDTNALQFRWMKAIASPKSETNTVFCVGDDDQSIYAFRGARVGNMHDFVKEYNVKHIVKLEQNYRSTSHILDAANAVISNNTERLGKNLWTSAGAGDAIEVYEAADDRDEARSLTQEIMNLHSSGREYSRFAVLYRNNAQSRVIEQYFTANSVPYRIFGGLRFFERQEVKDVIAYLRILSQPDDTSVLRVINHPPRGIGATTMTRIADEANAKNLSLWEVLTGNGVDAALTARAKTFVALIDSIRRGCAGKKLPETVSTVIEKSGLMQYYGAQRDRDIRMENLQEMVSAAAGYCSENGYDEVCDIFEPLEGGEMSVLDGFLSQATLESDDKNESTDLDCVQVMTVHASKGLEFEHVFLCGLENGLFPHEAREGEDFLKSLAEERRLMYVAMTRAKRRLRLSWCAKRMLYGMQKFNPRSSFIDEIPVEHLSFVCSPHIEPREFENHATRYRTSGRRWSDASGGGYRQDRFVESSEPRKSKSIGQILSDVKKASDFMGSRESFDRMFKKTDGNLYGFNVGDRVRHHKFGVGKIISLANIQSEAAVAHVQFPRVGRKELLLKFAKLEKLN